MHQIRLRLGLRPRPRWGSSQRSLRPLAGFKEEGGTGEGKKRERGRGGRRKGRKGKGGMEREGRRNGGRPVPPQTFSSGAGAACNAVNKTRKRVAAECRHDYETRPKVVAQRLRRRQ